MKRYLVADAKCDETVQPGERCIARGPVNDVAFPEKEAREISAVLAGYAGDEGHLVRRSGHRSTVRYMAVYSPWGIGRMSTLSSEAVELAAKAPDHAIPIAEGWLPEQSRARIPPAAIARKRPAPVGRERQQDPDRPSHRTRKMRDRGIDADDEIDESDHGRRVGEIVKLRADLHHARFARQQLGVFAAQLALNADEPDRGLQPERSEAGERDRTVAIVDVLRVSGPSDRDARPLERLNARAPLGDVGVIRPYIGTLGRDRRGLGLERQRKAAQRAMDVEGPKRVAARRHRGRALELHQQRRELWLHLQHDLGARARQQRDVARELDRVAQPLLGVQQDRVALQRIFSEPERTAVAATLRRHAGSPPPPFVLLKTAAKVADRQQRKRLIETRVGVILADFERPGIARQGLVMAIERLQREAAIVPGLHMVGSDRERAIISRDRILIAAHVEQAYAAVVVRGRIAGRQ